MVTPGWHHPKAQPRLSYIPLKLHPGASCSACGQLHGRVLSPSVSDCNVYNLEKGPFESSHFLSLLDNLKFTKYCNLAGLLSFIGLVSLSSPSGGVFQFGGNNYPAGILLEQPP